MTCVTLARMKIAAALLVACLLALTARAQIQVELQFKRVQYVAYEPLIATVNITNLAGRDIELRDSNGQHWFGFEITADEGRYLAPLATADEPPLKIEAGKTVARKINLTRKFPVHDLGPYHVRANVFFADLNKFFYSPTKVFQVGDARPIWQRTVGIPNAEGQRTYSLLSNRFPDHSELYVRVEDKGTGAVYNTFSLGRTVDFEEPHAELDRANQLHVLHCVAPRTWAYSRIDLNGEQLAHATFLETKTRPRLWHGPNGAVAVRGGMRDAPVQSAQNPAPKLSTRPPFVPSDD